MMPPTTTPSPTFVSRPALPATLLLIAAVLAALLYFNALDNKLFGFSAEMTVNNPLVNGRGDCFDAWLTATPPQQVSSDLFRPVQSMVMRAEWKLWNRSPSSYQFFSLILFLINLALVMMLTGSLTQHTYARLAAGLIFAAHPMATQAVQSVAQQGALMSLAGILIACCALVWQLQGRIRGGLGVPLTLFGLFMAVGCHEMGMLAPLWLLASAGAVLLAAPAPATGPTEVPVKVSGRNKKNKSTPAESAEAPFETKPGVILGVALAMALVLAGGYLALRVKVMGSLAPAEEQLAAVSELLDDPRMPRGAGLALYYLSRLVWPAAPSTLISPMTAGSLFLMAAPGLAAVAALVLGAGALVRRSALGALGLVWVLPPALALAQWMALPAFYNEGSAIFMLPGVAMAVAALAIPLLPAAGVFPPPRWIERVALLILIVAVGAMGWRTWRRGSDWKDPETFFHAEAEAHPSVAQPLIDWAEEQMRQEDIDGALATLEETDTRDLTIFDRDRIILDRANIYARRDERGNLIRLVEEVVDDDARHRYDFYSLMSVIAVRKGLNEEGDKLWAKAWEQYPDDYHAIYCMAGVELGRRNIEHALVLAEEALKKAPEDQRALAGTRYGIALAEAGRTDEAIRELEAVQKIDPELYEPYEYLARLFWGKADWEPEIRYRRAETQLVLALKKAKVNTRKNIGALFVSLMEEQPGKSQRAFFWMQQVATRYPNDISLQMYAARYFLDRRYYDDARKLYQPLANTEGSHLPDALVGLAWVLFKSDKDLKKARECVSAALQYNPNVEEGRRLLSIIDDQLRSEQEASPNQ